MTIYGFFIFDRHCSCIYSREFSHVPKDVGSVNKNNDSDMAKLLFGLLYSLKNLSQKLGSDPESTNLLRLFSTGTYRIHFLESLSNFKFVLVSDLATENLQPQLWRLYSSIFLNTVVYNALSPVEFGELKIQNSSFIKESDAFLTALPNF